MTTKPRAEAWTTRRLLNWIGGALTEKGIDSPRLCAEMLVAHVLGCERLKLYMDPDRPASPLERDQLRGLVKRALAHEPIQYLVGEAWFFGMALEVDKRVLIPRQCTQVIVEAVIDHSRSTPGFGGHRDGDGILIADVCTGSGAIAIALAKQLPGARLVATDISPGALELARTNAARHGVEGRIDFLEGDLLAPLSEHPATRGAGSLHYLVANPPYIPDDEWEAVEANVREHEPEIALRAGVDGLDLVRPLLEKGARLVRPGGLVLVEVAASRAREAARIAESVGELTNVEIRKDQEGLERVVRASRAGRSGIAVS
ncbi:MAG: peptide chain release factor N(5)-glutamine methyltransferase [Phycisphaerales bacterium]